MHFNFFCRLLRMVVFSLLCLQYSQSYGRRLLLWLWGWVLPRPSQLGCHENKTPNYVWYQSKCTTV